MDLRVYSLLTSSFVAWLVIISRVVNANGGNNVTTPVDGGAAALTPLDFWVSPGGRFAFGFLKVQSSSEPPWFSLSLFYAQLPQAVETVVWTANWGLLVSEKASLELSKEGDLVLTDGGVQVWSTDSAGKGVVSASVLEEGRLVLSAENSSVIWDSWRTPTDTLMPGQTMYLGMYLVESRGLYYLVMQADGNLVMYFSGNQQAYWASNTALTNFTQALFNSSGYYLELISNRSDGQQRLPVLGPTAPFSANLQRIVLTSTGILTLYVLSHDSTSWNADIQKPQAQDVCSPPELCGPYGICSSNDGTYTCSCPDGLVFVDAQNWALGCHTPGRATMDCDLGTNLIQLPEVAFRAATLDQNIYQTSEKGCAQDCDSTCLCAAATYSGTTCSWLRVSDINSGKGNSTGSVTYLKVAAINSSTNGVKRKRGVDTPAAISIGFVTGLAVAGSLATVLWFSAYRKKAGGGRNNHANAEEAASSVLPASGPVHFSYNELRAATNGFSHILGRGGFGPVYKGVLAGGFPVAVKTLEGSGFGEKQFRSEVRTIGSIHHVNLVRLRGYCVSGLHRLLVYDLMPNGSLDQQLFSSSSSPPPSNHLLSWETRFQIMLGTARGIKYLHEECSPGIVHCDIKPANILLDEDYHAKVSDFGMAQLVGGEFTGTITRVRGTPGYMAPEWMSSDRISSKADVYSFGMVVLELLSGRKVIDTSVDSVSKLELSSWAYTQFIERNNASSILDPRLLQINISITTPPPHLTPEFTRSAFVAFWCIQKDPRLRPSMGVALQMLEGFYPVEDPPCPF